MESWRKVFRDGLAPLLGMKELEALATGLRKDDPQLVQGSTTTPPPLQCVQDWPVEGACAMAYCGWKTMKPVGEGDAAHVTVAQVEEYFASKCFDLDKRLNEPAGCRWFLNWFDETPREEVRRELLAEVDREVCLRTSSEKSPV